MVYNSRERKESKAEGRYTKKQLIYSEKYCNQSDLLCALLESDKTYTQAEADKIMDGFKKGKVKIC